MSASSIWSDLIQMLKEEFVTDDELQEVKDVVDDVITPDNLKDEVQTVLSDSNPCDFWELKSYSRDITNAIDLDYVDIAENVVDQLDVKCMLGKAECEPFPEEWLGYILGVVGSSPHVIISILQTVVTLVGRGHELEDLKRYSLLTIQDKRVVRFIVNCLAAGTPTLEVMRRQFDHALDSTAMKVLGPQMQQHPAWGIVTKADEAVEHAVRELALIAANTPGKEDEPGKESD